MRRAIGVGLALLAATLASCEGPEQAPTCQQYTACIRALDQAAGFETNLDRFDPGGACWASEEQGKLCAQACSRGLIWERERWAVLPEVCQP